MYVLLFLNFMRLIYCDCGLLDSSYHETPHLISIAYIDGNTETGSEAIFSCPPGYNLIGTWRTQCDGDWYVPEKPKCLEAKCPVPGKLHHGHLHFVNDNSIKRSSFGSTYTVKCTIGYKITGSHIRTCMENGSWSGEPVRCKPKDSYCDLSNRIENGMTQLVTNSDIKRRYPNKTVYNILCDSGYSLKGSSIVVCGDIDIPICELELLRNACPRLSHDIGNGQLKILMDTNDDTVYQIMCDDGYIAQDIPFIWCRQNGAWSSVSPFCKQLQKQHSVESLVMIVGIVVLLVVAACLVLIILLGVTTKYGKNHIIYKWKVTDI